MLTKKNNSPQCFYIKYVFELTLKCVLWRKNITFEDIFLLLQISPVMEAEELTNDILAIKNIVPTKGDIWATFEVIENEELGEWLSY